jgi:hypothetical protein
MDGVWCYMNKILSPIKSGSETPDYMLFLDNYRNIRRKRQYESGNAQNEDIAKLEKSRTLITPADAEYSKGFDIVRKAADPSTEYAPKDFSAYEKGLALGYAVNSLFDSTFNAETTTRDYEAKKDFNFDGLTFSRAINAISVLGEIGSSRFIHNLIEKMARHYEKLGATEISRSIVQNYNRKLEYWTEQREIEGKLEMKQSNLG